MEFRRTALNAWHAKALLALFYGSAASLAAAAGNCTNTPIVWTVYNSYTDAATGVAMTSNISGDGVKTDASGNTVYSPSGGAMQVSSQIFNCSTTHGASYDAVLQISKGRSFLVNLGLQLGNPYQKFPPNSSMSGALLNVSDIQWCQNHG